MAYYLQFDGANDYLSLTNVLSSTQLHSNQAAADENSFVAYFKFNMQETRTDWRLLFNLGEHGLYLFNNAFARKGAYYSTPFYPQIGSDYIVRVVMIAGVSGKTHGRFSYEISQDDGTTFETIAGLTTLAKTAGITNIFGLSGGVECCKNRLTYLKVYTLDESVLLHHYNKQILNGSNDTLFPDIQSGNDGTLVNFPTDNSQWIFYDDGGGAVEQPVVSEFSGSATVNALASAQAEKRITASSDSLVAVTSTSSASKNVQLSGQSSVTTSSVSMFEKRGMFSGNAIVNLSSESYASKTTELSGSATVNVVASGTLIDGNFEIHSFSGGALITASASGQALKVGLVSGQSTTHASASGQASKVAHVEGNATVTTSMQSAFSKIASVFGGAISRIAASAIAAKRVVVSGASTVIATAYGQFFNTESNVETYQTIVQGRVKANPEIEGTVKSTTIQGRVK